MNITHRSKEVQKRRMVKCSNRRSLSGVIRLSEGLCLALEESNITLERVRKGATSIKATYTCYQRGRSVKSRKTHDGELSPSLDKSSCVDFAPHYKKGQR